MFEDFYFDNASVVIPVAFIVPDGTDGTVVAPVDTSAIAPSVDPASLASDTPSPALTQNPGDAPIDVVDLSVHDASLHGCWFG